MLKFTSLWKIKLRMRLDIFARTCFVIKPVLSIIVHILVHTNVIVVKSYDHQEYYQFKQEM